jgi:hypothetical protein
MTIGSWDPGAQAAAGELQLNNTLLHRLADYSRQQQLDQLDALLEPELCGLMKIDHALWQQQADQLDAETVTSLIRVFTLAEKIPGWEAGAESPVIPLARSLRRRGQRLEKPLLQWIREVSENRYLPYGPL